nr:glycosyltransferase [Mammaliicoccus sp. Marseille-Q6498]
MKSFTFLVHNIYHMGGTTKSISNLANTLSKKGHKVKIISVFKANDKPYFNIDENIEIIPVIQYDKTPKGLKNIFVNRLNKYTPFFKTKKINKSEPGIHQFSSYIEKQIVKQIKNINTDIVVGTRASYNLLIAEYAKRDIFKIGMEHMYLKANSDEYQKDIIKGYKNLDLITTLTAADQSHYQKELNDTPVIVLPNILKETKYNNTKTNTIIAAGRFEYEKGFDLLIESINLIQDTIRSYHYEVHIYGDGQEKNNFIQLIKKYQLDDIIKIYSTTNELSKVLSNSKITAIPSRVEGFGLVILEAMLQESVVIGYHGCYGPEFLIKHEENGYLIAKNDTIKFAEQIKYIIQNYENDEIKSIISKATDFTNQFDENQIYSKLIQDIDIHISKNN